MVNDRQVAASPVSSDVVGCQPSALSANDTLTVTVLPDPANKGLHLNGTNAFVTFGAAPGLGAAKFTLETWFRRDGTGIATFTGTGGITWIHRWALTKGMSKDFFAGEPDVPEFVAKAALP